MEKKEKNIISLQPLFSVLIANYNNGKYLMDAVESVRKQTYTNWEIILVDDCSTDNSTELYGELEQDKRIHVYYNDCNHGCGYTKHRCAELATGEICGFLDPDDAITEDALEIMVEAHIQKSNSSLIYSTHFIANENLQIVGVSHYACTIPMGHTYLTYQKGISHFATFKNDMYRETCGINKFMLRAVDQDLYLLLEEAGEVHYIDKPTYLYRQNTGLNISLGGRNQQKARYWELYAMMNACKRRGLSAEQYVFPLLDSMIDLSFHEGRENVYKSKAYRFGAAVLNPIKRLISK